jgi:hypothetical protein
MSLPIARAQVMEPRSAYYTSPVVVLDFQSLYPSQVIACVVVPARANPVLLSFLANSYNLCYSTCLGRAPVSEGASHARIPWRCRVRHRADLLHPLLRALPRRLARQRAPHVWRRGARAAAGRCARAGGAGAHRTQRRHVRAAGHAPGRAAAPAVRGEHARTSMHLRGCNAH